MADAYLELEIYAMDEGEEESACASLDLYMLYECDWTEDMTTLQTVVLIDME